MSETKDLREAVARAICAAEFPDVSGDYAWRVQFEEGRGAYLAQADAAIAAVLEHLIAAAEAKDIAISWFGTITVTAKDGSKRDATGFCDGHLAEWLRSFREAGQ